MSIEFPEAVAADIVEADTVAVPETLGSGVIDLPDGAAAQDSGSRVLEAATKEDEGFGELVDIDEVPAADDAAPREIAIPRQPGADRSEQLAPQERPVPETQKAKPDINLDIRGYGPFHEQLLQEGDAGKALVPYLHRLAVPRDDFGERSMALRDDDGDDIEKGLVDRLGDENGARDNSEAWELKDVLVQSLQELKARPELIEEGEVNWLELSTALLDRVTALGKNPGFEARRGILASAATAALMSDNPGDRIAFLERTAERGLLRPMSSAVNHSSVRMVLPAFRNTDLRGRFGRDDRSVQRLSDFSGAFKAASEEIGRYRQLVERDFDEPKDAHAQMREVVEGPMTADGVEKGDHAEALEAATVAPEYVDKYRVDPTRAERYALEEMFVQDQMDALFPGGDTTPFKVKLDERQRNMDQSVRAMEDTDMQLTRLFADTQAVIHDMSKSVVKRYTIARPSGIPDDTWKREELVAWRYRQLHGKAVAYDNIAHFVDPTILGKTSNFTDDVYDIAENGAALPAITAEALYNVIQLANKYQATTGDKITPQELKTLAQDNRRQLMKVAAINIDHFTASIMSESIGGALDPGTKRPAALDAAEIVRKPDGELHLKGSLFKTETASSQAGARLACVALRANIEGEQAAAEVGARNNKANGIELLAKIVFNVAYFRGIFDTGLERAA